jgi:hypothetical protein
MRQDLGERWGKIFFLVLWYFGPDKIFVTMQGPIEFFLQL